MTFADRFRGSIYVHNTPIYSNNYFGNIKESIIAPYRDEEFKKLIISRLAKSGVNITEKDKKAFFDFYGGFGEEGFLTKRLQEGLNSLNLEQNLFTPSQKFFETDSGEMINLYAAAEQAKKDAKALQAVNTRIRDIIKQIPTNLVEVNEEFLRDDLKKAVKSGVFGTGKNSINSNTKASEVYDALKKQVFQNSDNKAIVIKDKDSELSRYANIIRAIYMLDGLLNNSSTYGPIDKDFIIDKYIKYIIGRLPSLLGFAFQSIVPTMATKVADDVIKDINFEEVGGKYVANKGDSGRSTTVSTQDLKMDIQFSGKAGKALLKFEIPGLTLKYSGSALNNSNANIKLRDATANLGTLLHDLNNTNLSRIYNVLANYGRTAKILKTADDGNKQISHRKSNISAKTYSEVWAGLRIALTVNALMGQMTPEDFNYYLIISNKVYTIPDVIQEILKDNSTKFSLGIAEKPQLNPSQSELAKQHVFEEPEEGEDIWDAAQRRSDIIVKKIQSAKLRAGLKLKLHGI